MKKPNTFYSFILFLFFVPVFSFGQVCAGPITLSSQAEVDAFGPCTSITGSLTISGADITDLSPLSGLTSVGGDLRVRNNDALTNVDGLSGITSIGQDLEVFNNAALSNVDGLNGITSVGAWLTIQKNDMLTNVDGLNGITSIEGWLIVQNNGMLTNVDGLSGITSVGGGLGVYINAALSNVDGLSGITSVGGFLEVEENALTNVDGLSGITSVGQDLRVRNNDALTNVDGLSGITSVGQDLEVVDNDVLNACCGLFPLLNAEQNDGNTIGGSITIENNLNGCNSESDITGEGGSGPCDCRIVSITPLAQSTSSVRVNYIGPNSGILNVNGEIVNVDMDFGGSVIVELDNFPFGEEITASFGDDYDCSLSIVLPVMVPTMSQWALILFGLIVLNLGLVFIHKTKSLSTKSV